MLSTTCNQFSKGQPFIPVSSSHISKWSWVTCICHFLECTWSKWFFTIYLVLMTPLSACPSCELAFTMPRGMLKAILKTRTHLAACVGWNLPHRVACIACWYFMLNTPWPIYNPYLQNVPWNSWPIFILANLQTIQFTAGFYLLSPRCYNETSNKAIVLRQNGYNLLKY